MVDLARALKSGVLNEVMAVFMTTAEVFADTGEVAYFAMEIIVRYAAYFEKHEAETALQFFLSERYLS